jgi:hypothetical protein
MGLMGLGGLLAIVGGLLFAVVVLRAMRAPRDARGDDAAQGAAKTEGAR